MNSNRCGKERDRLDDDDRRFDSRQRAALADTERWFCGGRQTPMDHIEGDPCADNGRRPELGMPRPEVGAHVAGHYTARLTRSVDGRGFARAVRDIRRRDTLRPGTNLRAEVTGLLAGGFFVSGRRRNSKRPLCR